MSQKERHLTTMQKYRENEYYELSGESGPVPYPEIQHQHDWGKDGYCRICGADSRA